MTHTPGPWIAVGSWVEHPNDNLPDICNCDPDAMGQGHLRRSNKEIIANAHLIAAAPDLLSALEALVASHADVDNEVAAYNALAMAMAAINKARGK